MPTHDLVFSLGPNCRNTWNLRAGFGVTEAYPFDWWITPARSMLAMLDPGFAFRADAADLLLTPIAKDKGLNSVWNRRLNLLHHHDFRRRDNIVEALRAAEIDRLNRRVTKRFARLHADLAAAAAPLAVLNGIHPGWARDPATGAPGDDRLNGEIAPQELVTAIRQRLGSKVEVLIVEVGGPRWEQLEGGTLIALPDLGRREGRDLAPSYAEPVHVFRACYAALGLTIGATPAPAEAPAEARPSGAAAPALSPPS